MTIRQRLECIRRRALLTVLAGGIVCVTGIAGGSSEHESLPLVIGGFLVFLTGLRTRL